MTKVKLLTVGLLAAAGLGLSSSVYAQSFYAGVGVGQMTASDACNGAAAAGFSCDDSDMSYRVYGGYQLNKNFAVELGYADLGKVTGSGLVLGIPATAEVKATAWDVVAVGLLPLNNNFTLFGKLGAASWNVDASVSALGSTLPVGSASGTDLTYGLGAQYDFSPAVGVRVEWQTYKNVGDENTTGQSDVDVVGASVLFKF